VVWQMFPSDCKAAEFWTEFAEDQDTTFFLLEGSVRSTKTVVSSQVYSDYCENLAPPGPLAMFGKTERTLKQNVLDPLSEFLGPDFFKLNRGSAELQLCGRLNYLQGCPNFEAVSKIAGKTLAGGLADEATTYPHDVWEMIGTRFSVDGAKCIATMNPGPPRHWMKIEYLDRLEEANARTWHFILDDNPFISDRVKARLKRQYTGLWYKRYILGLWVAAEGAIFDMFSEEKHVVQDDALPKAYSHVITGVDYGTSNPSSFINIGLASDGPYQGRWIVFKEYFFDSRKTGRQKTDSEYSSDMRTFLSQIQRPDSIEVDPSAASFKVQLVQDGFDMVVDADNAVLDGIRDVSQGLSTENLLIHDSCTNLIESISGYVWDPKAQAKGEDKPLKQDDHAVDALRYAFRRAVLGLPIQISYSIPSKAITGSAYKPTF